MAASVSETHEFTVSGVPTIEAHHAAGGFSLVPGANGQVHVIVTKKARAGIFGGISEEELAEIEVPVTQRGDRIKIDAAKFRKVSITRQYTIEIEVTAPAATNLELDMAAGSAEAEGISGLIEATVNAGSFNARDVTFGNGSELAVNAGKVEARGALAEGASMSVAVSAGSAKLTLPSETRAYLDAKANAGSIDLFGWPVQVTSHAAQKSASGPLAPNASGTLRVRVNAGSVAIHAR